MTYGYVPNAQPSNVQYGQPMAYTEPQVQIVTVPSSQGWGWSDLALLAVASGLVGVAIGKSQSKANKEQERVAAFAADEEVAILTLATPALAENSNI